MNISEVLKDIESNNWWTEEFPGTLGLCMEFMDSFAGIRNHIDLPVHSMSILLLENGSIREETKEDEKSQIFMYIIEEMKKDNKFVNKLIERQEEEDRILLDIYKKIDRADLKNVSDKELWSLYEELFREWVVWCEFAVIPEGGDPYLDHYLIPRLRETDRIPENEINDVLVTFTNPVMYSFMDNEHIDFLKVCISYIEKKGFEKNIKEHVKRYFWIRNNYSNEYYLDKDYFLKRVKEETEGKTAKDIQDEIDRVIKEKDNLSKKKEEYIRKYSLDPETAMILGIYEKMGSWIDRRKRRMLRTVNYISSLLKEMAGRNRLEWKQINCYTVPELKELVLNRKRLEDKELKSRYLLSAYITTYDEKWLVTGEDAKKIVDAFDKKISKEVIKGIVANKAQGKFTGEVCVIMDSHKDDLPQGKILVTSMTRPDFVHLIKKASAIVTDEGGITCHAAVVSREFRIPCIIGTKNATRVLNTGDHVEVDTEKGVVRKI